ncbi:MAG TPA: radical SAM protein [Candidatus Acidoferrales bacterium]|nr:radical SAM protein [Candidatus Acidoferrales bacterium]
MSGLLVEMTEKALARNIPLSVQLDLTYRCNERCVHCYLDHDDHGEMTTAEIKHLLEEMADAGVFILTLSGGEIFLRKDFFELLEYARRELTFCVKLKTNAIMIREREAARLRDLGVQSIQISIYSHRPDVHDAITLVPGSLKRSIDAIRFLKSQGLRVIMANVLMVQNLQDYQGVRALADELGVEATLDPTITPMMDGDRSVLSMGVDQTALQRVFRDKALVGDVDEFCAIPAKADEGAIESLPCSAGHTTCYVSPYGDVYPCVQFPYPTGNVRQQRFLDIWRYSDRMNEVRAIRLKDLTGCSSCVHGGSCTRCPGLAFMEGNMRGPSTQDCEKSFAKTGVPSANLLAKRITDHNSVHTGSAAPKLVQIQMLPDLARATA